MVSVEHQIKLLHQCLVDKFNEIKQENEIIETRLHKIEELLYKEKQMDVEKMSKPQIKENSTSHSHKERKQQASKQKPNQKQKKQKVAKLTSSKSTLIKNQNEEDKIQVNEDDLDDKYEYGDQREFNMDRLRLNDATSEEHQMSHTLDDDGARHDTEKKELPTRCFEGHSFRPLTGWVNKEGNYEISKESIEFSPSLVRYPLLFAVIKC